MVRKPDIQYVGQFYIYGSEARKVQQQERREKIKNCSLVMAAVLLVTMVMGAVNIGNAWKDYDRMQCYVAELEQTHVELARDYRLGYDLAEIEASALAMGMIPREQANTIPLQVTVPVPPEEPSAWEEFRDYVRWFIDGLFA